MGGRTSNAPNDNATYTGQKKGGVFYVNAPANSMHCPAFFQLGTYRWQQRKTVLADAVFSAFAGDGKASIFRPLGYPPTSFHKDIYRLYTENQRLEKYPVTRLKNNQIFFITLINKKKMIFSVSLFCVDNLPFQMYDRVIRRARSPGYKMCCIPLVVSKGRVVPPARRGLLCLKQCGRNASNVCGTNCPRNSSTPGFVLCRRVRMPVR